MKRLKHPKYGTELVTSGRPLIWTGEVGEIFGVSRVTVLTWLKGGKVDHTGRVRLKGGWRCTIHQHIRHFCESRY